MRNFTFLEGARSCEAEGRRRLRIRKSRTRALFLALCLGNTLATSYAASPREIDEAILGGRTDAALELCERQLGASPEALESWLLRARLLERLARVDAERANCTRLTEEDARALQPRLRLALLPGAIDARFRLLEEALTVEPRNHTARLLLAEIQIAQGMTKTALGQLAELEGQSLGPNACYCAVLRARALAAGSENDRRAGQQMLLPWMKEELGLAEPHFEYALLALAMGQVEAAQRHGSLGRYLSPASPRGFLVESKLAATPRPDAAALAICERGLEFWPHDSELIFFRIETLINLGELDAAARAFADRETWLRLCAPLLYHRIACELAWCRQSTAALAGALAAWSPRPQEGSARDARVLFEARFAALEKNLPALRAALERVPLGQRAELDAAARILEDEATRLASRRKFLIVLGSLATVIALVAFFTWVRR